MENAETMTVEVAYANHREQVIVPVELQPGSTLQQAIEQSHLTKRFPEIEWDNIKVGIFGKLKNPGQILQAGDRVEIYRPLIADPKEVRRQRAAAGKKMKKGGGSLDEM